MASHRVHLKIYHVVVYCDAIVVVYKLFNMEEVLLEEHFEDIFFESALEESTEEPHSEIQVPAHEKSTEPGTTLKEKSVSGAGSSSSHSRKRVQHTLNKKEREKVIAALRTINGELLLETVVKCLSEELHMQHYPEREQLMISILDSSKEDMERICAGLADTFIELYIKCDKGKEKYGRFQVEWHQSCSKFLLDSSKCGDVDNCGRDLWLLLTKSTPKDIRNPVMIAITAAIYSFMIQQATLAAKESDNLSEYAIVTEPDEVYMRFAGAALASMFNLRYKDMKSKKSSQHKERVSKELQVLEWMRMTDKSDLPTSLAYRDRGGMYFPDKMLLPFVRSLDNCVRENANKESFQRYGKNLVKVVSEQVNHNQLLIEQFQDFIKEKVEGAEFTDSAIMSVYSEFSRKLCNTRLNEFLDAYRQTVATEKGKATLAGQNLRDTLLTQHINLKPQST